LIPNLSLGWLNIERKKKCVIFELVNGSELISRETVQNGVLDHQCYKRIHCVDKQDYRVGFVQGKSWASIWIGS